MTLKGYLDLLQTTTEKDLALITNPEKPVDVRYSRFTIIEAERKLNLLYAISRIKQWLNHANAFQQMLTDCIQYAEDTCKYPAGSPPPSTVTPEAFFKLRRLLLSNFNEDGSFRLETPLLK